MLNKFFIFMLNKFSDFYFWCSSPLPFQLCERLPGMTFLLLESVPISLLFEQ